MNVMNKINRTMYNMYQLHTKPLGYYISGKSGQSNLGVKLNQTLCISTNKRNKDDYSIVVRVVNIIMRKDYVCEVCIV